MKICTSMLMAVVAATSLAGAEFTVVNKSNQEVRVCTIYHRPFSEVGAPSGILITTAEAWIHEGHWLVRPGEKITVYRGNKDRIYVRIEAKNGAVIKPGKFHNVISNFIHPERYKVEQQVQQGMAHYGLKYGANLEKSAGGKDPAAMGMRRVDGFYEMDAHTDFTVSFIPQPSSPNLVPQPAQTAADIRGNWRDLGNQLIRITQNGTAAHADAGNYEAWSYADGTVKGNRIEFMHYNANRRPINGVTGIVKGNRIEWDNNTTWTREVTPVVVDLRGNWRDLGNQPIRITQSGAKVHADAGDYEAWSYADGTVKGSRIEMTHYNADRQETDRVAGVVKGNRIEWENNTSWSRE